MIVFLLNVLIRVDFYDLYTIDKKIKQKIQ